eukprot:TRINITY_DN2084_c0_g1_i1.p2 TRINITY_DN2084_c0_g1~~TRINITY_DN2084_c0_g1_i1.p2  ORF type:complete len:137 (-),score=12.90 TRINITY_DN2084_c0_g1_i1:23-433(-)
MIAGYERARERLRKKLETKSKSSIPELQSKPKSLVGDSRSVDDLVSFIAGSISAPGKKKKPKKKPAKKTSPTSVQSTFHPAGDVPRHSPQDPIEPTVQWAEDSDGDDPELDREIEEFRRRLEQASVVRIPFKTSGR